MEVAASIPTPRRCQLRQLVPSKAPPSVLAPRSTLPRHLPAFAAPSCPLRDGHRRVQHGVRAASESTSILRLHDGSGRAARGSRLVGRGPGGGAAAAAAVPVPARVPHQRGDHAAAGGGQVGARGDGAPGPRVRGRAVPGRGRVPRGRRPRLRPALLRVVPVRRRGLPQLQEPGRVLRLPRGADGQRRAVRRGFSQGAGLSAALAGLQQQGLAFTGVAKVKCVIAIAGAKIRAPVAVARAFDSRITCPSLHFIGDEDFVKVHSEELVQAFADPLVIRHPCGHTVPKLDEKGLQTMLTYLDRIEREIWEHSSTDTELMGSN